MLRNQNAALGTIMEGSENPTCFEKDAKQEDPPPPIIFSEKEYRSKLEAFSPGAKNIPHDMMRFDPKELERPVMEVLHAPDTWATQEPKLRMLWDTPSVVNEKDGEIQTYLETRTVRPDLHAYIGERQNHLGGEFNSTFEQAQRDMESTGPSYMRQREYLANLVGRTPTTPTLPEEKEEIRWGK